MAYDNENGTGMVMPVGPMGYSGGGWGAPFGGGFGGGMFGGDISSLVVLFLFFMLFNNGNWGGNNGNNFIPYVVGNQTAYSDVQRGFDQSAIMGGINSISTNLCNGFAGVNQGVANGFAQAEISANARQIADLQQAFAAQTATTAAINGVTSQLAQCCCENRLATANLNSTIISENCADREALNNVGRDILAQNTANTNALLNTINGGIQSIKDQMCADNIDAKNDEIAQLRQRLYMSDLAASQNAQTATIQAGQRALANEVESFVRPQINPAYIVPNPYACYYGNNNNCGCGCGCNG